MKSIVFICFYFGKFPEWFELYFETLRLNSTIDFVFYTDCDYEEYSSHNVTFNKISYEDYVFKVIQKTGIDFTPANPYKLCDFRPLLATIHNEDIKDYDFYGYADLDLIFGDIRSFYTDELLNKYDVFSTHAHTLSDHCVLFRNIDLNINMYNQIGGWAEKLSSPYCVGIGEDNLFLAYEKYKLNQFKRFRGIYKYIYKFRGLKLYLKEQYTTPFTPIPWINGEINEFQPSSWFYKDGKITNSRDKNRNFLYLHFMNFKSSKYRHDGSIAPWEGLRKVCYATKSDMIKGLSINDKGIFPLD
jgi:hypothetical protein